MMRFQCDTRLAAANRSAIGPSRTDAMEATMTKREANQKKSLDAFLAKKAEFDALVAELQQMSADHFGADPEAVLWGTVGTLTDWNAKLRQITDAHFHRGEFAE